MTDNLPPVLVVVGTGAVAPLDTLPAAAGLCEPVFCFPDTTSPAWRPLFEGLQSLARCIALDAEQAEAELAAVGAQGIITFAERLLPTTAALAGSLGLRFHSDATVHALTDKTIQRALLRRAGARVPAFTTAGTLDDLWPAIEVVGLPAVVKPVVGHGSRDTYLVSDREDLDVVRPDGFPAIVESRLTGRHPAGPCFGGYVSVESAILDGEIRHWAVTDRFPLTEPLRETGMIMPSQLPTATRAEVHACADEALHALGVRGGITHTEVMLCAEGPTVIEVNGRLGGGVNLLCRDAWGMPGARIALLNALGRPVPDLQPTGAFAATRHVHFPSHLTAVHRRPDTRRLRRLAGVQAVQLWDVADRGDWRAGTLSALATVRLRADSFPSILERAAAVQQAVMEEVVLQ